MISVRSASPSEYERVGALSVAAYRALPIDHLFGDYDEGIVDVATRAEHGEILVAVRDGDAVVGSVMYVGDSTSEWSEWTEPGEAQFRLLAVDPRARGLGAGAALVDACIAHATAERRPLLIHTTPWMQRAQRIYAHFGFVRRTNRDVPYEVWRGDRALVLPPEWIGQAFLAYSWSPPD